MNRAATFANRLALLRNEKGMTQDDLAKLLSEIEGRKKSYSLLTISAWETGDKCPTLPTFILLCDIFNVSADYLTGRNNDAQNKNIASASPDNYAGENKPSYLVTFNDLHKFDGEPIYVVFNDKKSKDRWGILDWTKKQIAFTSAYMSLNKALNCVYYSNIPESQQIPKHNLKKRLSMNQLLSANRVWIEMISADEHVKGRYNGWFRNNEDKSNLINASGLTLPYEGLNISFNAYSSEI